MALLRLARLASLGCAVVLAACSSSASDEGGAPKPPSGEATRPAPGTAPAATPETQPVAVNADTTTTTTTAPSSSAPLAPGVTIDEVVIYQGTRVALARAGTRVTQRALPVVQGRDALIRLFVSPETSGARTLDAELTLMRKGKVVSGHRTTATIARRSVENDAASTFNFMVPGSSLGPDVEYSVRILDGSAKTVPTTTTSTAQYPRNGTTEALDAQITGTLKVLIVPVIYGGDGSNRMPDVSATVVDAARKRLLEFYPVANVDVRVRQPVSWSSPVLANGQGWDELLDAITRLRLADNAPRDVYYYGAFAPGTSIDSYCGTDCLLGLSNMSDTASDSANRASIGALYATPDAIDTIPHELGHAHGRAHAPCGGATDPDATYPYPNATIGAWGYSVVTHTLVPPTLYDQMSYCAPAWQSDYTYRALYDRLHSLATMRVLPSSTPRTYRMLKVASDGTGTWSGEPFSTTTPIEGTTRTVAVTSADGQITSRVTGYAYGYDHARGSVVLVPYDALPAGILRGTARARLESLAP